MKKFFVVGLLSLLWIGSKAQDAMPFLRIDRDPATAAMGGIQAISGLQNPGLVPFTGNDVVFNYQHWAPSTVRSANLNLLGALRLGDKMGIILSGAYQNGRPYTMVDASGNAGDTFTPSEMLVGAGFGFRFTESLSAGATVCFASEKLTDKDSYTAIAADVLLTFRKAGLTAVAGVANLGTPVKSGKQSFSLPMSVKAGVGYEIALSENKLNIGADADYFFSGGFGAAAGAEFAFQDMVFVRGGVHLGTATSPLPTHISLGAGFKYSGFHVDLCWLTANQAIGNTVMAGLGYSF